MALIVENKKTVAAVVSGKNVNATISNAISEFALFMKKCTGNDLYAFPGIPSGYKTLVYIAPSQEEVEQYGIKIPKEKFEDDTVFIKIKDNIIVLDGGVRGKLYSVYEFLERYLGVRFYAPNNYKTPHYDNLEIKDEEFIYTPKIKFRDAYAKDTRFDNMFSARVRNTSENYAFSKANLGGGLKWATPSCHTSFEILMPPEDPETGFDKHPEYYSFVKKQNKRVGRHFIYAGVEWGEGDICWSNPEVIDIVFKRLQNWILEKENSEIFSISQNDWPEHCECEECTKTMEKYGGRWSAPIIVAINELARRVKKWQQEDERVKNRVIYLETFAYQYGAEPPIGLEIEDNVIIRLCTHEACFYHALDDESCPVNKVFMDSLNGWKKIAKHLYIWDYTNNHCMEIAFNTILRNIQRNAQLFANSNPIGVFSEFEDDHYNHMGLYPEIRQYLIARVLWNPYIDFKKEYEEAFEFFYGKSAKYIMQIEEEWNKNCDKLEMFHPRLAWTILKEHYSEEFLKKADELFKKALEEAETRDIETRIRKDYVCLKFTRMYFNRENDKKQMDEVMAECKFLGVTFSKMRWFIDHYYNGIPNDLFLASIEERNKKADLQKIMEVMK